MPKVTIWIREEDYPQWKAIENKPEWLHERLKSKTISPEVIYMPHEVPAKYPDAPAVLGYKDYQSIPDELWHCLSCGEPWSNILGDDKCLVVEPKLTPPEATL